MWRSALWLIDLYHVELHTYEGAGVLRCLMVDLDGGLVNPLYPGSPSPSVGAPPAWLEPVAVAGVALVFCGVDAGRSTASIPRVRIYLRLRLRVGCCLAKILKTSLLLHLGQVSYSVILVRFPIRSPS